MRCVLEEMKYRNLGSWKDLHSRDEIINIHVGESCNRKSFSLSFILLFPSLPLPWFSSSQTSYFPKHSLSTLFSLCLTADLGPTLHTSASQDPQLHERDTASSEGKCGYDPSVTQTLLPKSLLLLCFLLLLLDPNQFKFQCQSRNQDSSSPSPSKQSLPSQFSYCYRYLHSSMWQSFVYLFYTFPI